VSGATKLCAPVALLLFLVAGCESLCLGSKCTDFSRSMSLETYSAVKHERPYELTLRKGGALLRYIGVEHSRNPLGTTAKTLNGVLTEYAPTKLYVEGPLQPPKSTLSETVSSYGESGLLMYFAKERGIEIQSLDLPIEEEVQSVAATFGRETAALFYGLRATLQQEQESAIDRGAFLERKVMPWLVLHRALPEPLSAKDFARHLPTLVKGANTLDDASLAWFDPLAASNLTIFNEIARYLVDLRDRKMIEMLVADVKKGHKILAAAGFSHVVMQEPDIRRLLGCIPRHYDKAILRSPSTAVCD
jgi:hypothetical protein